MLRWSVMPQSTDQAVPFSDDLAKASAALLNAVGALEGMQREDGHFCGELEGDSILQSEYLLMKWILRQEDQGGDVLKRIAAHLRWQQRDDGGWGQFPGSDNDLSATVKGYFVLKLMGDDPEAPHMQKARDVVLAMGGAERANTYTAFFLACLGQVSWKAIPVIPPEIVSLPRWFYFHLEKISAWTRTMILPLSLVATLRPRRHLRESQGIDELFLDQRARHTLALRKEVPRRWRLFFGALQHVLTWAHTLGGSPWRRRSINRAFEWSRRRAGQDGPAATDGLGAIFPPMVYWQIVLMAMGYDRSDPLVKRAEAELDAFFIESEDGERIRIQPCFSPVWDTGIALCALCDCGLEESYPACDRAAEWLRSKECRFRGDWVRSVKKDVDFSGWFFEYHNAWYPDVDDTAMVTMALKRSGGEANTIASARGMAWLEAMQNDDGGWAAFDRTRERPILEYVPFADHNAMQDPSCPDITGRVLESLAWQGIDNDHPMLRRGVEYVKRSQDPAGCFFGRWGVNYIYGTWQSIVGPIRCGEDPAQPWIQRAATWLRSVQKDDGSFGESPRSYEDPALKGVGESTASQTAWAAMSLLEIAGPDDPDLHRAINWLIRTQLNTQTASDSGRNPDGDPAGSWAETQFTGTGFPRVFYLRYHMYRLYFPLMAIGRWLRAKGVDTHALITESTDSQLLEVG